MKIGIVSESYYPAVGGYAEHIHNLAVALRDRGHTVKILTTSYGEYADAQFNSPDILRVGKSFNFHKNGSQSHVAYGWGMSKTIRAILAREKFDVLHLQAPEQPMLNWLALVNSDTVNVGTFHAMYDRSLPLGVARPLVAVPLSRLHGRIVVSEAALHSISRYFPEGEYSTVPNGVNVDRFEAGKPLPELAGRPTILFVGNFVIRKGLVNLLEAFGLVQLAVPNVRLVAVGDGQLRARYQRQLGSVLGRDILFTGRVPAKQLADYYASADVFCAPATGREAFGIVLIEAMAAGKPIVASNIDGYRQVLAGTNAALTVEPHDIRGLAQSLITVLQDKQRAAAMGAAGRAAVEQYRWANVAAQVEQVYQKARQAYPATQPVMPGWRWLERFLPARKRQAERAIIDE